MKIKIPYEKLGDVETYESVTLGVAAGNDWTYVHNINRETYPGFFTRQLEYLEIPYEHVVYQVPPCTISHSLSGLSEIEKTFAAKPIAGFNIIYFYPKLSGNIGLSPVCLFPEAIELKQFSFCGTDGHMYQNVLNSTTVKGQKTIEVLKFIEDGVNFINNFPLEPYGTKNLIYYVVNTNIDYIDILELSLKSLEYCTVNYRQNLFDKGFEILFIGPQEYLEKIKSLPETKHFICHYMSVPYTKSGVEASMDKLRIYDFEKIKDYRKIFFVDADILFKNNPTTTIFSKDISDNKLYSSIPNFNSETGNFNEIFHNIVIFGPEEVKRLLNNKIHSFNAGQYIFLNSNRMKAHFTNLIDLIKLWKWEYFFEQGFMNYYFNRYELSDVHTFLQDFNFVWTWDRNIELDLNYFNSKCTTMHFLGTSAKSDFKLNVMRRALKQQIIHNSSSETNAGFLNLINNSLVSNSFGIYKNTKNDKDFLLKKINSEIELLKKIPVKHKKRKGKNLIYYTVFHKEEFLQMTLLSLESIYKNTKKLDFDILFITDKKFKEKLLKAEIVKKFNIHFLVLSPAQTPIEASINKLKIFNFEDIEQYNKILFLDSDILVLKNINQVLSAKLNPGILYTATPPRENLTRTALLFPVYNLMHFTDEQIDFLLSTPYLKPFNAGQFMFLNNSIMLEHFKNIIWLSEVWPDRYFYEQALMNHYFVFNGLTKDLTDNKNNTNVVDFTYSPIASEKRKSPIEQNINDYSKKHTDETVLLHFAGSPGDGETKLNFITKYIDCYKLL